MAISSGDTPEIKRLTSICASHSTIDSQLFTDYKVYRGLRAPDGRGVLTGLTEISDVMVNTEENGKFVPCPGALYYRGYNVKDIVADIIGSERFGFEEIIYLLLFGRLPDETDLSSFKDLIGSYRKLPPAFFRDIIMKSPSVDLMNSMARSVLTLYSYDPSADDLSLTNVLNQCLYLIATYPMLAVYSYQAYAYYKSDSNSFFIHDPDPKLSTAENILHMLRIDSRYSNLEARVLDLALILHAEHGGGNNSTFTTRLVTSTGTDTYSAMAAAMGSLKGPKHGGANIKVCRMFDDIKSNVRDWKDKDEVRSYLTKILDKEAFDRTGLIYGLGHAIYQVSDPRAEIFRNSVGKLSKAKGRDDEFALYSMVEEVGADLLRERRKTDKGVCANVDFYSGFCYQMLGLPTELFTPIFAVARIVGWSAHRLEEIINSSKIMRPAYKYVGTHRKYVPLGKRVGN
ncbi:MAG TPA: citrate/2-methylcitrate synthase [Candidatus Protoclostridium stercorigallinarum]|uniref:Citrate synthase n=1 Tax=Candidatus Protoclostridium stercorigallinarum TaxID=2838741 RepID=A0A9D1PZ58_9FIRM|nr:citrate/2-methylcitrate synthase [Candidatus Protoclostridium stercorigallinarum]